MEQTPEGLAAAAVTRAALKQKKRRLEQTDGPRAPATRRQGVQPSCVHEVAVPEGSAATELDPSLHGTLQEPAWTGSMAKAYPFALDPFQSVSIACIERNESVLVAAHTSAGKTAVAEYAIAKSLKNGQRVVYTSPLKALSNQKYRELSEEFGDVGLMTGDVTLNPSASCMVMTTEILRSMIYRGSELLREVAWVVFDEVHYMQDRERGVVWEEVIIFMPKAVRMVFLSATLPNALEFAEWVAYVHGSLCHVVYTEFRPTPLVHYAFPLGGNGVYLLVDDRGRFREDNFAKMREVFESQKAEQHDARSAMKPIEAVAGEPHARAQLEPVRQGSTSKTGRGKEHKTQAPSLEAELDKILRMVKDRRMEPVIVFSFSRRECERYANMLASEEPKSGKAPVDFNSSEEKEAVAAIFGSALQCLSQEDRELPFVQRLLPMLQRGIGMHHSGLLPILKELVEILFQEQLIKCLFSTETFAMGVNMPAKTVLFTSLRKWDGQENRWVGSGEYIQMSGRAGRRGKDERGTVIMVADDALDAETCQAMVRGNAAPLLSSFKLSYYTLINLMRRVESSGADMNYVISRSFSQFQHERQLPQLEKQLANVRQEAEAITTASNSAARAHLQLTKALETAQRTVLDAMLRPECCLHFLRPGRIVRVAVGATDWGYGVVVNAMRLTPKGGPSNGSAFNDSVGTGAYWVDTLLSCHRSINGAAGLFPASLASDEGELCVVPVELSLLTALSTLRITLPADLKSARDRRAVLATLRELLQRYPGGTLPALHPVHDMGITDEDVADATAQADTIQAKLSMLSKTQDNSSTAADVLEPDMGALRRKAALLAEADTLHQRMKQSQLTSFRDEARSRALVLRKLGHLDSSGCVTLKGRAASEIDTADELLAAELMFNGTFRALDKHQLAALVSCLVPTEKSSDEIKLTLQLSTPLRELQDAARRIASVSNECKLEVNPDVYVESFKATLMDIVYAWSKGASFGAICAMTDVFEGSIIRAMRRLDELMSNLECAADVVGDAKLAALFAASRETIRRDLPFAASLYV